MSDTPMSIDELVAWQLEEGERRESVLEPVPSMMEQVEYFRSFVPPPPDGRRP